MKFTVSTPSTLLEQLALMAPDCSKTTLRKWIKHRRIFVNGKLCIFAGEVLKPGSAISLESKGPKTLAEGLKILFEDSDLIVVDKPAHLLSVETKFETERTVHAILKRYIKKRVYPVHRLDQKTRGVMVFALSLQAYHSLKEQFANHSIYREYRATAHGCIAKDKGTIRLPLKEDPAYRVHVDKNGEMAITHFEVLKRHQNVTDLKLILETGKKNQIRVHLMHMGHPILGDRKYGSSISGPLALHAHILAFTHPQTQKYMEFISS